MCSHYPGMKLEPALQKQEDKHDYLDKHDCLLSYAHVVHTTANRSFYVMERERTSAKCFKMNNPGAKRAKLLFFVVKDANCCVVVVVT